ncbi:MAG: hypothetical protein U0797_15245 [Gemmataceae bacterium]
MLGLRSYGHDAPARRPFARPSLEALETRYVPTPILTLGVKFGTGRNLMLGGDLTGVPNSSNVTINLSGVVSGTAKTDWFGHYSVTLTGSGLGKIYATAAGATAMEEIWDTTPVVTSFSAMEGPGHVWTFTGTVSYRREVESLTVNFGGSPINVQGGSTGTEGRGGSFQWVVTLNGTSTDNGLVWAQAVSPWGTASAKAYAYVLQTGT